MSGADTAGLVIGLISGTLTILESVKNCYSSYQNVTGIPEVFREVAQKLPLVLEILRGFERSFRYSDQDPDAFEAFMRTLTGCKDKAAYLDQVFKEVMPNGDLARSTRYCLVVRCLGKDSRLEHLMKGILEDIQLLYTKLAIDSAGEAQAQRLAEAIEEVSALPPSLPDHLSEGQSPLYINHGSAPQNIHGGVGAQHNYSGSGAVYHNNANTISFGKD